MSYPSIIKLHDWFMLKAGGEEYMSKKSLGVYLENIRAFILYTGSLDPDDILRDLDSGKIQAKVNEWVMALARAQEDPKFRLLRQYTKRVITKEQYEEALKLINE